MEVEGQLRGRQTYVVRPGDSLWSVAARLVRADTSRAQIAEVVEALWRLNAGRIATGDPDLIRPGQILVLPARA